MTVTDPALDRVLLALQSLCDEAFALADRIDQVVTSALAGATAPDRGTLAPVAPLVLGALSAPDSRLQGAGFVAATGLLAHDPWWLEWFTRDPDGRVDRLHVQTDPEAMGFHDYRTLGWYAVPQASGARHVTGPYVDNVCTEDYTLTFTRPVLLDGSFAGVAGADVGVRSAEHALLPVLRSSALPLAIVNAEGRTLVSNTGSLVCGELVGDRTHEEARVLAGTPLRVVRL